jgi:hypothetical protein
MPAGSIAVIRAFCSGLRAMRVAIGFDSPAPVAGADGVVVVGVLLPESVSAVVPAGTVVDAVGAAVEDAAALRAEPPFAAPPFALAPFALTAFAAPPDFAPPDTFEVVFGDPLLFGAFEPPFATCTPAFGPFGPAAACGTSTVASETTNTIASG